MDDATQKLVGEWEQAVSTEGLRRADALIRVVSTGGRLRDALEAAQRPPVNPVVEAIDAARDSIARGELASVVIDTDDYPQRPPVSPEAREEIAAVLFDADEHHDGTEAAFRNEAHTIGGGHNRAVARAQADALLARFSVPSQPVYDEEKIARWLFGLRYHSMHWLDAKEPERAEYRRDAAALVAALRGGELTREETNRG